MPYLAVFYAVSPSFINTHVLSKVIDISKCLFAHESSGFVPGSFPFFVNLATLNTYFLSKLSDISN